jgi:uncharacterized protein YdcH (DUF465 family)
VTDRRQELGRHYLQPGSPAYKAIKQAIEDQGVRTEEIFDRLEKRMDRLDRDIARNDQGQERLASELVEMRRDVGELRDATHIAANKAASEAKSAADTIVKTVQKKWYERWQAWGIALIAFIALYKNVGTLARDMTSFWRYIIGETPPAQIRHIETKGEAK